MTPEEVSVLCALVASEVSISQLALQKELPPGTAAQLGSSINHSGTIHTMTLGWRDEDEDKSAPELLRTLSVGAGHALEQLSINSIRITSEWLTCDSFSRFTALRSLSIAAASEDCCYSIPLLIVGVGKLRALESLHISRVNLSDSDAEALAAALRDLPMVAELGIRWADLGKEAGRPIGSLIALGRLQNLDLGFNDLQDEGVSAMVDAILSSPPRIRRCGLQQLNLRANGIGPTGGLKLAELIAHSPRLRGLELASNPMGGAAADALWKALKLRARSLEELDVSSCDLGPREVVPFLSNVLRVFPVLSVLRADSSDKGDLSAHALAQSLLLSGCRLHELDIQDSGITQAGALELAGALVKAYALKIMNMSINPLGPRGAAAIFDALATASTVPMDAIHFGYCRIGDNGASAAGRLIERRGCRNVFLSNNKVHATGAKAIVDSAAVSVSECTITFLNLSHNPIGNEGVRYILDKIMLSRRRLVHRLNIGGIKMGVEGAMAVKLAVEKYDVPYWLRLSKHSGDSKADGILEGVKKWERESRPSRAAILELSE